MGGMSSGGGFDERSAARVVDWRGGDPGRSAFEEKQRKHSTLAGNSMLAQESTLSHRVPAPFQGPGSRDDEQPREALDERKL